MLNNIIWIVFDSARYDSFMAADTPSIDLIGPTHRRFSYASWTAPSHYAFLMGLPPHANEPGVLAADAHRRDLLMWKNRIGLEDRSISLADFVPTLSLPAFLKRLNYRTEAYVSLPVLNPNTLISQHFDHFVLMPTHNDLGAIIKRLSFGDSPHFIFINTGETHYPYLLPDEKSENLPYIAGVHGVWRDIADPRPHEAQVISSTFFDPERLRPLWQKQVACIEYLDRRIAELIEIAPPNTYFMITSDHGELFGEDGYFGHGPVIHEKVFEVFFVEGASPHRQRPSIDQASLRNAIVDRLKLLGYA